MKIGIDIAAIVDLFEEQKFDVPLAIETDYTHLDTVLASSIACLSDLVSSGAVGSKPQ